MRDSVGGDAGAEAAPLLQPLDRPALRRKCSVSEKMSHSNFGALDDSVQEKTCFLQHGGETASGKRVTKKLVLACALAFAFMIFECIGGSLAHSVAILSDAAHMFSDVFSFLVSIYSMRLIRMKATSSYSFGYHRAETIGALISVLIVCVITGGLVLEAIQRLIHPTDIDGKLMFIVATTGIGFNILLLLTLGHDHHHHLGGSCSHDHGHGHSHSHAGAHAHGAGHGHGNSSGDDDHDHAHSHAHSHGPGGHGCGSAHADHHACGAQLQHTAKTGCCSSHKHCSHAQDHDHDHAADHSPPSGALEYLSVERSTSQNGLLHVKLDATDACGYVDDVSQTGATRFRSHAHGASGHTHCLSHSHDHAHGHSHCDGGHHDDHQNQNLRGAIVHVLGDILQSVGVAIAGAIIWYTDADPKWLWVDPACTFLFAISVVWVTKTLIFDITKDLMEAAPADISVDAIVENIVAVSGVIGIHDLHVWRIGTGKVILTAHIDVADKSDPYSIIECVEEAISEAGIAHSTVQICSGKVEAA